MDTSSSENEITMVQPRDVTRENALLLDVRTPAEFHEVHIAGSVLLPLDRLNPAEVARLAEGKSECVIVCRSGRRAETAAEMLKATGIAPLRILEGGVLAWQSAGLPVERGARKVMSLERQVRIAAGSLVFIGAVLGYFVHPAWIGLSAFVGAGLVFAGLTDTCGMGLLIARLPWNNR